MGAIRIFLAWVVVADHWRVVALAPRSIPIEDYFKAGFNAGYAVLFFYVISGFLITYTLTRNYNLDAAGTFAFYRRRAIRIFSLYWPMVVLAFLLIAGAWADFLAKNFWDKLTSLFLLGADWRLAFASYPGPHWAATVAGLEPAWTLGAELTFYLAAPLLLRSWKVAAVLLLASFGLRAAIVIALGPGMHEPWTYTFAASTFGFFLFGHLICRAGQRWPVLARPFLGVSLLACAFVAMACGPYDADFDAPRFWASVLLFTVALPGLFEATKNIRWMNLAGDLSYPIYLVHMMLLLVLAPWLVKVALPLDSMAPAAAGYVSTAAAVVVVTFAGALVHWLLEKPTAHAMTLVRWRWPRPRPV
jgi:peptidoglycan/LPS O-acetylase OafA/YrhL